MKLAQVASGCQSWPFEGLPEEPVAKQEAEVSSEEEAQFCNGDESKHNGNDGPTNGVNEATNGSDSEANFVENNGEVLPDTVPAPSQRQFDPVAEESPDLQVIIGHHAYPILVLHGNMPFLGQARGSGKRLLDSSSLH